MVQVRNFTTLLQAIALAGGPTRFASDDIVVLRTDRDTGQEHVLHLNYRLLSSDQEEHRPYNLILWPGDTVILK
jgi:protein involved in polysaccharide export with SLBB domain